MKTQTVPRWWPVIGLLWLLWASRLAALTRFPLHNDEGLHLTRAVQVWQRHPFWQINDGKIINHWLIGAFYPQNAPVFVGRAATVLVVVIGLAAGYALMRHLFGQRAALLAGVMWLASPYLFFYERLALSDAQAGALVVVALWASFRQAQRGRLRDAVFTGAGLALAALFKLTAVPFALMVALTAGGTGALPARRRLENLIVTGLTVVVLFTVPVAYLMVRTADFFSVALGWIDPQGGSGGLALSVNAARLWTQLTGFGFPVWTALLLAGVALLLVQRTGRALLLAAALPLLVIAALSREVLPRHYVVALPLMLTLSGAGLGSALDRLPERRARGSATALAVAAALAAATPFAWQAYRTPEALPLPDAVRTQYVTQHSAGFGLQSAVESFPRTITRPEIPIVASMFPDSCRRANFYAAVGFGMICADAPGLPQIEVALSEWRAVYVLVEGSPGIGLDVGALYPAARRLGGFPRPGETEATASVTLWLVEG